MRLAAGRHLGPYEIQAALGEGGMGVVYRARDTRLDRAVAIKTLAPDLVADPERRARFQREARAIAAVAHPHICALYDVGSDEGIDYLVMELLEGDTLADGLARGPLPVEQALQLALQISEGLAAAHRHGIVHRDLKPGNVMLTRAGAKLVDFGLARLATAAPSDHDTRTASLTSEGQILGTLNYMSPEQLQGRPVDVRSDVFALGAVLYEIFTGRRAFEGSGQASVIGHILHTDPPPVTDLRPGVPPALARLVRRCLAKDPDQRWSTAHDVHAQLQDLSLESDTPSSSSAMRARSRRHHLAWAAIAAGALAAGVLAGTRLAAPAAGAAGDAREVVSILPPAGAIQPFGDAPQISPDGRRVAFVATDPEGTTWLYVRSLDEEDARPLPGTEDASQPFWAPDSQRLGFFAQGQLKVTALSGGTPRVLAPAPVSRGGTWSGEDVIVFLPIPGAPPLRISAAGGEAVPVPASSTPEGLDIRWFPSFLPDNRHYLYFSRRTPEAPFRLSVASIDSGEVRELVDAHSSGVYVRPGYLLFARDGALMAQPFDARTRTLSGTAAVVAERVGFNAITYQALFSASDTGRLAYQPSATGSELVWFDRRGTRLATAAAEREYNTVCLTDNDRRIVYELATARTADIDLWTQELGGGPPVRLTFDPATDFYPVCAQHAPEIVFASLREGRPNLYRLSLDAPGSERAIVRSPLAKIPMDWSRAGHLLFGILAPETSWDIMAVSADGGTPQPVVATPAEERHGRLSPDSRWLAYVSNDTGAAELYVQPFPATGARWQLSRGGAGQVQWRRDGKEIFYVAPSKKLMAVEVTAVAGTSLTWREPRALMDTRMAGWERSSAGCCQYAVAGDGERFLISTATETAFPVTVVLNWAAELRR